MNRYEKRGWRAKATFSALAVAAASVAVSGEAKAAVHHGHSGAPHHRQPSKQDLRQAQQLSQEAGRHFSEQFLSRHAAYIAVGTCFAWNKGQHKFIAILNPGFYELIKGDNKVDDLVYSEQELGPAPAGSEPPTILLNGPYEEYARRGNKNLSFGAIFGSHTLRLTDSNVYHPGSLFIEYESSITGPAKDPQGQQAYQTQSGMPVMVSKIFDQKLSFKNAINACNSLDPNLNFQLAPQPAS